MFDLAGVEGVQANLRVLRLELSLSFFAFKDASPVRLPSMRSKVSPPGPEAP